MSDDFLKNPVSLFDVKGKTAIVTGATGALGAIAAKVFAGAGANVVICANNAASLKKVAEECEALGGGKVHSVAKRPSSEENCATIVNAAVDRFRSVDILVVASGQNKVAKIVDQKAEDFLDVMDANVTQSWLMAKAASTTDARTSSIENEFCRVRARSRMARSLLRCAPTPAAGASRSGPVSC